MKPENVRCELCIFYQAHRADIASDPGVAGAGECRRNAPQVGSAALWTWPAVNAGDWCGEYSDTWDEEEEDDPGDALQLPPLPPLG